MKKRKTMVARGCVRGVARPVALVDAARIQSNLSLQDGEFATLRQFKNVGVVGRRLRHTVVRLDDMCLLIGFKKELRREGGGMPS